MKYSFPFFYALKLLNNNFYKNSSINSPQLLCFFSISISTFILTFIIAIMNGFEQATYQTIQGMHADLIIKTEYAKQNLDVAAIDEFLFKTFPHQIKALSAQSLHFVMVDTNHTLGSIVLLIGTDPKSIGNVIKLSSSIIQPSSQTIADLLHTNHVLIGKEFAKEYSLKQGDTINIIYPTQEQKKKNLLSLEKAKVKIGGIFSTGVDEFDAKVIFASHEFTFDTVNPDKIITQILVKLENSYMHDQITIKKMLSGSLSLPVIMWQDLYPALLSAMKLEKYVMTLILCLILIMAMLNISSIIYISIMHQKKLIAILYAMGMGKQEISKIFIFLGFLISTTASILGMCTATLLSYCIDHYQIIPLPNIYYTTYLPAKINFLTLVLLFIFTSLLSLLTAWYPSRHITKKNILNFLRKN